MLNVMNDSKKKKKKRKGNFKECGTIIDEVLENVENISSSNELYIKEETEKSSVSEDDTMNLSKEFEKEYMLLYGALDELHKFNDELEREKYQLKLQNLQEYISKTNDAILECKKNKIRIIEDLTDIKKTILKYKYDNNKVTTSDSLESKLMTSYINNIMNNNSPIIQPLLPTNDINDEMTEVVNADYEELDDN